MTRTLLYLPGNCLLDTASMTCFTVANSKNPAVGVVIFSENYIP